jgi:hypothetical protein
MTYVTKQEYFDFSGIDLDIELKKSNYDNTSQAVEIFIRRIQNWMLEYLEFNYFITEAEMDETLFKKGVLHQIDYFRMNGDMSIDATNKLRVLAPNAYSVYHRAGYCNTVPERSVSAWV